MSLTPFYYTWDKLPNTIQQNLCILDKDSPYHHYKTPKGKTYPSITTILSKLKDKSGLESWRNTVGEQVAEHIMQQALHYGRITHNIIEQYLQNDKVSEQSLIPEGHLRHLTPLLHKINHIQGIEVPLYSDELKVAGTADCIARYDDVLSIIDFKTSRKQKQQDWIIDYFLQATAYSVMYEELTRIQIPQIVILLSAEDGATQEFVKNPKFYKPLLYHKLEEYYS